MPAPRPDASVRTRTEPSRASALWKAGAFIPAMVGFALLGLALGPFPASVAPSVVAAVAAAVIAVAAVFVVNALLGLARLMWRMGVPASAHRGGGAPALSASALPEFVRDAMIDAVPSRSVRRLGLVSSRRGTTPHQTSRRGSVTCFEARFAESGDGGESLTAVLVAAGTGSSLEGSSAQGVERLAGVVAERSGRADLSQPATTRVVDLVCGVDAGAETVRQAHAIPLALDGLAHPWLVASGDARALDSIPRESLVEVLNTFAVEGMSVRVATGYVVAWSRNDAHPVAEVRQLAYNLAAAEHAPGDYASDADTGVRGRRAAEAARLGRLRVRSLARGTHGSRDVVAIAGVALSMFVTIAAATADPGGVWADRAWMVTSAQLVALLVLEITLVARRPDHQQRHRAGAEAVRALAEQRRWLYRQSDTAIEDLLVVGPFAAVRRITAVPVAKDPSAGEAPRALAWVEGDLGPWPMMRPFASAVATVPVTGPTGPVAIIGADVPSRLMDGLPRSTFDAGLYGLGPAWTVRAASAAGASAAITRDAARVIDGAVPASGGVYIGADRVVVWAGADHPADRAAEMLEVAERVATALG